ncbi:MAG: WAPL family protein [Planctomycetes bacterium]|nr:WAPL family protein [Planctomycetota bacterium]
MSSVPGADKKILAGVLGIVLSCFGGVHRFVLGDVVGGLIRLVLVLACGIGSLISLVEGIIYLTKSDEDFVKEYVEGRKAWF